MSEYWKSLPKKYCEFCKCWITDNKSSRDFHERGFRHQANVRKRVKDIHRNNRIQNKELQEYNHELMKIEAAALSSFQQDISRDPTLAKEYEKSKSIVSRLNFGTDQPKPSSSTGATFNRFGESVGSESETLVSGKKRALETIAKSLERKNKWLEAKNAEGKIYYWNKDTLETRFEPPKSGFMSLEEQNRLKSNASSTSTSESGDQQNYKAPSLYGAWKTVKNENEGAKMIDLQLPGQDLSQIMLEMEQKKEEERTKNEKREFDFKEKTIESLKRPISSSKDGSCISFKKRSGRQNIRLKLDDD